MSTLGTILKPVMKEAAPIFAKFLKVAGKEVSKKVVIGAGVGAGVAVVGGVTGGVLYHNHKKKAANDPAVETTEEAKEEPAKTQAQKDVEACKAGIAADREAAKADEADQAPIEESGAEKIDHVEVVDAPVQVVPQQPIINPAPQGPNPVFQYMNQQPQMNGFMPGFMPGGMPQQVYQMPQANVVSAPIPDAPKAEEVKAEELVEVPVEKEDVVLTPKDIAEGKGAAKTKKVSKSKVNKANAAVEINSIQK